MTALSSSVGASSKTATFTDRELYRASLRNAQAEIVSGGRGAFQGELTKVDFERLWIQRAHESLARVASVYISPARPSITFATRMNEAATNDSGMEVSPGDIVFHSPGELYHVRTAADSKWGAMSLTPEDLAAAGRAITGRELTAPAVSFRMRPAPALMSRLLNLHEAVGHIAKASPDILTHPEVAHTLEQSLVHVMVRCLSDGSPFEASGTDRRHAATLSRLEALLMANYHRPLHLAEICTTIGASERTLRECCEDQLGMGPVRYLWLRRMNLARRALLCGIPATTTVTEIAMAYGFWELGRFALRYRTLFGELPSASLARSPIDLATPWDHPFAGTA
jgi:AraC-like DNA-binding protein